ncbi:MAG: DUF3365 domain-containing protein [Verrucomicrobiales bacterium]|nr:DUF3365 domain-containing protein [Verrucomicrobiales bacterium]
MMAPNTSFSKGLAYLALLIMGGASYEPARAAEPTAQEIPPALKQETVKRGKAITSETFGLLSSNLVSVLKTGGISNALPFCSAVASPLVGGVAKKHGVLLRRVTHKPRNPANRANEAELKVLSQFEASLAASTNLPQPMVVQWMPDQVTFLAPIVINNSVCLQCHGRVGKDLSPEQTGLIRRLYPQDEATGFVTGQLRGIWRIDFPMSLLTAPKPSSN